MYANSISGDGQRGLNWSQVLLKYQRMKGNVTEVVGLTEFQAENVARPLLKRRPPCTTGRNSRLRPSGKVEKGSGGEGGCALRTTSARKAKFFSFRHHRDHGHKYAAKLHTAIQCD